MSPVGSAQEGDIWADIAASMDAERPCPWWPAIARGMSLLYGAAERSVGGVQGMPLPYASAPWSWPLAVLSSTPNMVNPDDIEWFLLIEPSMLVGVCQPVSSL